MKLKNLLYFLFCLAVFNCSVKYDYLGMSQPGMSPEIFAPGVISTDAVEHGSIVFSYDGRSVYWSTVSGDWREGNLLVKEKKNGQWSDTETVSFSRSEYRDLCPVISANGNLLFFTSGNRTNEGLPAGYNLWVSERDNGQWQKPVPLPGKINTGRLSGCTIDPEGTLYYMSMEENNFESCDIYLSRLESGKYNEGEPLGLEINTSNIETSPFISPDGKYLLFSSSGRSDSFGEFDLYISIRNNDGSWDRAINMGELINSDKNDWFPSVSPDGKYIFFISGKSGNDDYYWIDTGIIDRLK